MNITILGKTLVDVSRDYMLSNQESLAFKVLSESLFGIKEKDVNSILNGDSTLINNKDGTMSIILEEDSDYKKSLSLIKNKSKNSIDERYLTFKNIERNYKLKHAYFSKYILDNGENVYFPKILTQAFLDQNKFGKTLFEISGIEKKDDIKNHLDLFINKETSNIKNVENLLSDINHFGYIIEKIKLLNDSVSFGRIKGKLKTLNDLPNVNDRDILLIEEMDINELVKNFKNIEKSGAVISFNSNRKILSHMQIFYKNKDDLNQIPLVLLDVKNKSQFLNLVGKDITLDFKKSVILNKE